MKYRFKRNKFVLGAVCMAVMIVAAAVLAACYRAVSEKENSEAQGRESVAARELTLDEKVDTILSTMSNEEKIGQMVMMGINGEDVTDDSLFMLHQYHIGGVILFDRNMSSKEQVANLNAHLQEQAYEKLPLLIAVDEEGGRVARMKEALPPPSAQSYIGSLGEPKEAYNSAYNIANELKAMGFNVNFAPVADVGAGDRNFSDDPAVTAAFVQEAVDGYQAAGMICSLKHFPGLGRGESDTHKDAVVVNADLATISNNDMLPFKNVIANGSLNNYMVMVSHITYPLFAGNVPASVSPVIMKDILRSQLGYQGVIITDDLEMGAIANYYGFRRVGVEAVKAGADMVLVCHEYQHEADVYLGILEAVQNGEISQADIDASVRRILKLKLQNIK